MWHGSLLAEPDTRETRDPSIRAAIGVYSQVLKTGVFDETSAAVIERFIAAAPPGTRPASVVRQAKVELLAAVGRAAEAEEALRSCVDNGLPDITWIDHARVLAPLRALAGFAELRSRVAGRAAAVLAGWRA